MKFDYLAWLKHTPTVTEIDDATLMRYQIADSRSDRRLDYVQEDMGA